MLPAACLSWPEVAKGQEPLRAGGAVDFTESIHPLFARHCFRCHGTDRQKGGLRLDSRDAALQGGDSGTLLSPGKADESLLIELLTTEDVDQRMPHREDPLAPEEVELVRRWIDQGARWPQPEAETGPAGGSSHWAFQPIGNPPPPDVRRGDWARDPIDRFILARLEQDGLAPSPKADRFTLIRRLSLDLTGLPPAPEEVRDFVGDPRPDAYERLVDRLLASPHFGERWGGHWLDLARYGDSDGFEQDEPRPFAYRWRDWVIGAINADMPFDRFTVEQLAGDLLPGATESQVLATGFHRNAPANREGGIDKEEARVQAIVDRVNTTGTVWLGLTVGCAECHSHKFDPLRQAEYYQLFAFFNDATDEADRPVVPTPADRAQHDRAVEAYEERVASLAAYLEKAPAEERARLEPSLQRLKKTGPPKFKPDVMVFGASAKARQTRVHLGGDFRNPGAAVTAGVPAVLPKISSRRATGEPPDRLDLALWLVDPANPLTARVEANRIWQSLFGIGLVATPDDFGTQGDPPTHPELLDHLATRLLASGWSRKALIRAIVGSSTYRQDSARRPDVDAIDPNNLRLHRQNRFRLEAEVVRDLVLAASGLLNRAAGGPGIRPPVPQSFKSFAYRFRWNEDEALEASRRGLYIFFQRNMVYPMLRTFDRSDANIVCVRRERSNTPLQALTLLNDPQFLAAYRALGLRLLRDPGRTVEARIRDLGLLCLGREPSVDERRAIEDLLSVLRGQYRETPEAAAELAGPAPGVAAPREEIAVWIGIVRVIMNTDQFITRE